MTLAGATNEETDECLMHYIAQECGLQHGSISHASFFLHFPPAYKKLLTIPSLKMTIEREAAVESLNRGLAARKERRLKGLESVKAGGTMSVKAGGTMSVKSKMGSKKSRRGGSKNMCERVRSCVHHA